MEVKLVDRNKVPFSTLKLGDVFLYGEIYYMKFYHPVDCDDNIIELKGTYTMKMNEETLVSPVNGYFMVVSK